VQTVAESDAELVEAGNRGDSSRWL